MWISILCQPNKGLWHCEQGGSLEVNGKVRLPTKVHYHHFVSYMMECCPESRWKLVRTIPGIKLSKTRLCPGPTLFSLMFSAMLTDAFADTDIGIGIRHRMDGSIFNLRRLKAKTKVKTNIINDFLFVDDCALNSISDDMQQNDDKFAEACTNFGLTISITKREVMHQPAPRKTYIESSITINGQCLKAVTDLPTLVAHSLEMSSSMMK